MRIKMVTSVAQPFSVVANNFGEDLFKYLAPPPFVAKLDAYEGSEPGDEVRMNFNFPKATWVSRIESKSQTEGSLTFTDIGLLLPSPLASWHHTHGILKQGDQTLIIDDMMFDTHKKWQRPFVYSALFLGFYPRRWQYKRYFEHEHWRDRSRLDRPAISK